MVNGMRPLATRVLGVRAVIRSIKKRLLHRAVHNSCRVLLVNEKRAHLNRFVITTKILKRRYCEKVIELRVCLGCEDEYSKYG